MLNFIELRRDSVDKCQTVYEVLKEAGIRPSITKLDKLAKMGGLRINDLKVDPGNLSLSSYPALAGCLYIVKSGKKEYFSILVR